MNLSLMQGIRVLDDNHIQAAIEELAEEVRARLNAGKTARMHHVKDMLALIETIPNERAYWRSVVHRRDEQIDGLKRSLQAARDVQHDGTP